MKTDINTLKGKLASYIRQANEALGEEKNNTIESFTLELVRYKDADSIIEELANDFDLILSDEDN